MKTKLTLIASALALGGISLMNAAPVSPEQAKAIAASFGREQAMAKQRVPRKASEMKVAYTAASEGSNCYYIINSPASEGFTIISADDRLPQVLGYTDRGDFDPENIPCNMKWWLESYRSEIAWFLSHPEAQQAQDASRAKAILAGKPEVAPLTKTTWNQSTPYNNLCPIDGTTGQRSVTGCVATAMAQVMKVYNWPVNPTGDVGNYNFEGKTYQWDKMLDSYSGSYTDEEARAVALLMRGCGAAVEMNYSSQASGAYSFNVGKAWHYHFGYDASMRFQMRDYFSQSEWNEMVYDELAAGRPVYYSGQSAEGGHAFVCDGYAKNGYFHFNWGWGGYQDGYFRLYALNPTAGGIGSYEGGYNSDQAIYTHLIKRTDGPQVMQSLLVAQAGMSYRQNGDEHYICWKEGDQYGILYNPLGYTENIDMAIRVVNANNPDEVHYLQYGESVEVPQFNGWQNLQFAMPENVDNGVYNIYVCYRTTGTEEWQVVRCPFGTAQYITAVKDNSGFKFSDAPAAPGAKIIAGNMIASADTIAANGPSTIKFSLVNTSEELDYIDNVNLDIYKASDLSKRVAQSNEAAIVPANTVGEITFTQLLDLEAGDYVMRLSDDKGNVMSDDYKVYLGEVSTPSYENAPFYVPLAAPGFINSYDAIAPIQFVLAKTNPDTPTASGRLGIYIFNSDDKALGSLELGTVNLTDAARAFATGSINFSQVFNAPGFFYWQFVQLIEEDGETKARRISQKIPVRVYSGVEIYEGVYYNLWRGKGREGEIVTPGMDMYQGVLSIPDRLGAGSTRILSSNAFAFSNELTSLSLPGGIYGINGGQFFGCTALKDLEIRGTEPPALSKYAFPEGSIAGISLSVANGGANVFKRTAGWSDFFFPAWTITAGEGVVIASGLETDPATSAAYAPYYVSPNEQPEIVFNVPDNKSIEITYNLKDQEAVTVYSNGSWKMPKLGQLDGTVVMKLADRHEENGIGEVDATDENVDVYTMQGVRVMRNADRAALKKLQPGIYVVGGRKVVVK